MTRFLRTLQIFLACEKADLCKSFLDVDREFEVEQWVFNEIDVILLKKNFVSILTIKINKLDYFFVPGSRVTDPGE